MALEGWEKWGMCVAWQMGKLACETCLCGLLREWALDEGLHVLDVLPDVHTLRPRLGR
jgi:hypothetical protein